MVSKQTRLSIVFNAIFVIACLAVGARALTPAPQVSARQPSYKVGERLDIAGVETAGAPRTLVFYMPAGIQRTWTFYQGVTTAAHGRAGIRLVVMTNDATAMRAELKEHGVDVDEVVHIQKDKTKIRAVPTTLLVDSTGVIRRIWVGIPPQTEWPQMSDSRALDDRKH
jgi:hypothetical protein